MTMTEGYRIHPQASLGAIHLRTAGLDRMRAFYLEVLGLAILEQSPDRIRLGPSGGRILLELQEDPEAGAPGEPTAGLYHYAILLPGRADLARMLRHFTKTGQRLQGAADHLVSEALYLTDPEGNGIEVYADRPRSTWPGQGDRLRMSTVPLDVDSLIAEPGAHRPLDGMPQGARVGHIHLQVGDLAEAERFYKENLGFELTTRGPQAAFLSAGGYHHHIGLNTWAGEGLPRHRSGQRGLERFTVALPSAEELESLLDHLSEEGHDPARSEGGWLLRDPAGVGVLLRAVA
jgi:catechol 2,3-dioxygenase